MRLSVVWGFIALLAAASISWGWSIGAETVPPRAGDQTNAVPADWYADLPLDPAAAAFAFLARIPAAMRERGESYSDTRMRAFEWRVLCVVIATLILCVTRLLPQARQFAQRWFKRDASLDTAMALQYFIALYALTLPAEIYATFLRPRRFGFSDQPFGSWLADSLINWGVLTAFYMAAVLAIYRFIRRHPGRWVA